MRKGIIYKILKSVPSKLVAGVTGKACYKEKVRYSLLTAVLLYVSTV